MSYKWRQAVRRVLKIPVLVSGENGQIIGELQLLDVSDLGAKLQVNQAVALPQRFRLTMSKSGQVHRICELVWRSPEAAGVRFIGREIDGPASRHVPSG